MSNSSAMGPRGTALVAQDFAVPIGIKGDGFMLRMLSIHDLLRDYEAVTSSCEHLRSLDLDSQWPQGLSLEQNLVDLGWHEKEFQRRSSFAYTVVDHEDLCTLGCVYIYPSNSAEHDADIFLWARQSELASGLEKRLCDSVGRWIASDWPFGAVRFPGRD